ncbi:MAG: hypothetical protein L6406_10165 [Desulfobacterales bacterium]|nr:hypothetical protein [Desulfobacterales bacterium]
MYRFFVLIILILFIFSSLALGQDFKVVSIQENLEQAILYDRDTDKEWSVQVGDEIDGWRIVVISRDYVTIVKQGKDLPIITKIPVKERIEIIKD